MNIKSTRLTWPAALTAAASIAMAAPAAGIGATTPGTPPTDVARVESNGDLDAQLEAARRKLEQAASEVARLSAQLSSSAMTQVLPFFEPGHAIIGVQLESAGNGARVREVSPGGPAAQAGIRAGDVIVAVNGTNISGTEPTRQVLGIMHDVKPDSAVSVRVLRDGKPRDFTVTARASPAWFATLHAPDVGFATWPELPGAFMFHGPLMDMELATLTPRLGSYFGSDKGVLVVRAPADGALKLEDGDVILAIDGRQPASGAHATRILGSYQPGEKVTLRIMRQHKSLDLEAVLPENPGPLHKQMRRVHPLSEDAELLPRRMVIIGRNEP